MSKNNYVIHYRNLQQCLEKAFKLKKVHIILKFKQEDWIKPYIDFKTQKRKEATNDVDQNLFKLLNNAVYGETMENLRKRIKVSIVKKETDKISIYQNLHMSVKKYLIKTQLQSMKRKYV